MAIPRQESGLPCPGHLWVQDTRLHQKARHISALSLTCSSPFAGESDRATLLNVLEGRLSWNSPVAAHLSEDARSFIKAALQRAPQ